MADDTVPQFIVNFAPDTLKEDFPAVYSSYTIALSTIPSDTVSVTAIPDAQLNIGGGAGIPVQLDFGPYPAALIPQELKVKPVDDAIYEGYHQGNIAFVIATSDTSYDDIAIDSVSYLIEDNDLPPGINPLIDTDTFFTEGLPGIELLFSLGSIPSDTVYLTIDPDDQLRITGIPGEPVTLLFEPNATSLSYEGVNIRAVDDDIYEGIHSGTAHFIVATSDTVYDDFSIADITWTIYDNDSLPGIAVGLPDTLELSEDTGQIPVAISLHSIPYDTVKINVIPDDQLRITAIAAEPVQLIFAPNGTALSDHIVNVKAYDDDIVEGLHSGNVSFTIETSDTVYSDMELDAFTISIIDNDFPPGIIFSDTDALSGNEGDTTLDFSIALQSIPSEIVSINFNPDVQLDLGKGAGAAVNLKFKADSALLFQTVQITIYDDAFVEGLHNGTIYCTVNTTDPVYTDFIIPNIYVLIDDNDIAAIAQSDPDHFRVFPSASDGIFNYSASPGGITTITVFDQNGNFITNVSAASDTGVINLTDFAAGNYYILLSDSGIKYFARVSLFH